MKTDGIAMDEKILRKKKLKMTLILGAFVVANMLAVAAVLSWRL